MKQRIIKTPTKDYLVEWLKFIYLERQNITQNECITIDFGNLRFLDTNNLVMLACLLEELIQNNCLINFIGGLDALNQHLINIRFYEQWNSDENRSSIKQSRNNTTLCLWKINKNTFTNYSTHAQRYFKRQFVNDLDLTSLTSNLDEVFNNIFDHSEAPFGGYIISQFYPKNKNLSFSVCDFGEGIAMTLNNFRSKNNLIRLEDNEAILEATRLGTSAKSTPRNRGFGLDNIKSFVKNGNGMLNIISNKGQLALENNKISLSQLDFEFKGALITVRIDLNTFENEELEEMTLF